MAKSHKKASDWNPKSKRFKIAELAESNFTKRETYAELRPLVESGLMVFSANVGGRRQAKPLASQLQELKNEIGRVYAILGRASSADFDSEETSVSEEIPADACDDCGKVTELFHDEESEKSLCSDCLPQEEEIESAKPTSKGKERIKSELAKFLRRVREIRSFCADRAKLSEPLDFISVRPVQAASKLIPAGIPADALLSAMTLHWPMDARRDAGIADFDFVALSHEIMKDRGILGKRDSNGHLFHDLFGYVLVLAENRQPIMLVGPHGTGKSHIAHQIADFMGADYGETPMTSGATRGDLLGRFTASPDRPFIAARFDEIYGKGGVFNFEEIDASDPSMLIVLNNALAANRFYNSNSGEKVTRHDDFIAFSTANTFGLGATREYVARERLDAATIDRWRMGRVWVGLDESVEESMLYANA